MFGGKIMLSSAAALLSATGVSALVPVLDKRQYFPANATGLKTITEPGKEGVCETTPGVNSYSGYIDLAPDMHTFFWFFESRRDPANDPITLWLNGGPGSDSLIGLFQELGPCNVTANLTTQVNPYSWSEVSNMLFLSQPFGVGFSYSEEEQGSFNPVTGSFQNATEANATGTYPAINATEIDTTDLAAIAAWHVLQGFLGALPQLDAEIGSNKEFNLWTESYGGYNKLISNGTIPGVKLDFNTLGIGNGIIDEYIQAPHYPEFAVNNSYGIKSVNDTVYNYMKFALNMPGGCLDLVDSCRQSRETGQENLATQTICSEAQDMCRDNYFADYLNIAEVQNALGVSVNYTESNNDIYYAFQATGDFVYNNFLTDLEELLAQGLRISFDADYICNWFGGEAISLAMNYTHSKEFAAAGYEPFTVDGTEYGEVRQYGNFSFLRIYDAGHEVPYYQPQAALALFNRTLNHWNTADGTEMVTANLTSYGSPNATHTQSFVPLPPTSTASASATDGADIVPIGWRS
ncbi:unnamed protein product [Aureobasidium pullulans]|nr:unnamed protein product [Aureobasidium pullulans]